MKKVVLYIVLLGSFLAVSAQETTKEIAIDTVRIVKKQFNEENITNYKNDTAFEYEIEKEGPSLYNQFSDWINRILRKFFSWFFDDIETPVGLAMVFFRILPYLIAAFVLYLIINFFLKINSKNIFNGQTNKQVVQIANEEELLHSKDLPALIAKAIKEENYRLAIRYQYVLLLQKLSNKELIIWEQQKTNEDYIKELAPKNIHTEFEIVTRFYDFVWYGNFEINNAEYQKGIENIAIIERKIN